MENYYGVDGPLLPSGWLHLTVVWNSSTSTTDKMKVFVNGQSFGTPLAVTTAMYQVTNTKQLHMGHVDMDELTIWDHLLTQREIEMIYNMSCDHYTPLGEFSLIHLNICM